MYLQKVISTKIVLKISFLLASWRSLSKRHVSTDPDPDPPQNFIDPENCPKLHFEHIQYSNTVLPVRYCTVFKKCHCILCIWSLMQPTQILLTAVPCHIVTNLLIFVTRDNPTSVVPVLVTCLIDQRKYISKISWATFLRVYLYLGYIDWKLTLRGCSFRSDRLYFIIL